MTKTNAENTNTEKKTQQVTAASCDVSKSDSVLSDLYKNVTMAQNSIKVLLPYVEDKEWTKNLHKQVEQYDVYVEKAEEIGKLLNFEPTPATKAVQLMAKTGIKAKMLTDRTNTHVAKIMLQGTLNGIIDLYGILKNEVDIHPDITLLAKQVLRYEEGIFENMKSML